MQGHRFFKDGVIDFGVHDPNILYDGFYREHFGFSCAHNGIVYANDDLTQSDGVKRMTGLRFPDEEGKDARLRVDQEKFCNDPRTRRIMDRYRDELAPHIIQHMSDNLLVEVDEHVGDPHPKRTLRINAHEELIQSGEISDENWLRVSRKGEKTVLYKVKKAEIAKFNKYVRCIGDLGVGASLEGWLINQAIKAAVADCPLELENMTMSFCKTPSPPLLDEAMRRLIQPPKDMEFVYFSDDSCLSVQVGGEVYTFNIDISGCDASHSPSMFESYVRLAGPRAHLARRVINQCKSAMLVRSVHDPKLKCVLELAIMRLYSGSTLTTALNNVSCNHLGIAFSQMKLDDSMSVFDIKREVVAAGYRVGYKLTVEHCEYHEDIQFLKHSPTMCHDGEYHAMLNLGVLLRASGCCKGDLPGVGDYVTRAYQMQAALLNGMYPRANFTVGNIMKRIAGHETNKYAERQVRDRFAYKVCDEGDIHHFKDESIYRRYRLDDHHVNQLLDFAHTDFGEVIANPALGLILQKDYELDCVYTPPVFDHARYVMKKRPK